MKAKQILSILLSIVFMLTTISVSAYAETTPDIIVYLTVSNQGVLAVDNEDLPMANRPVTVTDVNNDGTFTYEEALVAAHKTYNSEDGYLAPSGFVSKLWSVDSQNNLFFLNNTAITAGVSTDTVKEGDYLVASINKDSVYWADWYTFFDKTETTVKKGEEVTLNLKGHLGMAFTPEDSEDKAISGIEIGMWENGAYRTIDNAVTDENGNVTLSFEEEGIYYISAEGMVLSTVTDYNLVALGGEPAVYGSVDFETNTSSVAYTEQDYKEGPYPAEEILYMPFDEWKEEKTEYFTLYSANVITQCPIMAPVCVIEVKKDKKLEVLNNIAKRFFELDISEDVNMQWIIADLASYTQCFPETSFKIPEEEKQKCIDKIIKDVEDTTKPGNLAKDIIALRAMGYDPENLYNENMEKVDALSKLTALVDEKTESLTNIYTLPYVLIALQQGEDYMTEEQKEFLVNSIVLSKSEWQSTTWGTDGATPMLLALAPYRDNEDVNTVINETVEIIKRQQTEDGSLGNGASTGLAIAAFSALGEDFNTLADGLMVYVNNALDGFVPEENLFSTEQGFRGLVGAYGEKSVYDFKDMPLDKATATFKKQETEVPTPSGGGGRVPTPVVKEEVKEEVEEEVEEEIKEAKRFSDVGEDMWYTAAVEYVTGKNFMMGESETQFKPDELMTRAMLVTVLYRIAGEPDTEKEKTFKDVTEDSWYKKSVEWATENNLVAGYEDNTFRGEENITREQLAVMLYRFAEGTESEECITDYEDANEISDYAKTAFNWAVENKLINGVSNKRLAPTDNATRAQIAAIIMRYEQLIKGE